MIIVRNSHQIASLYYSYIEARNVIFFKGDIICHGFYPFLYVRWWLIYVVEISHTGYRLYSLPS